MVMQDNGTCSNVNQPYGFNDVPNSKDSVEVESYRKGLAQFIAECATPMTIAVQGDWGTGKTSTLAALRQELDKLSSGGGIGRLISTPGSMPSLT